MIIAEIKKEKKHLMRVLLDNGEELLLDKSVCTDNALRQGETLDEEKITQLGYESEYQRAKSRALWYLDRKDYSEKSLYTKLTMAGFDSKACAAVLARLTELGVVDDLRFATHFAERCLENNISERQTFHKLLEKGIPYDMAKDVLAKTETDEEGQLLALIEKKYAYKLTQEGGAEKVYAALIRKGFSYSGVRQALKKVTEICEEY